MSLLFQDLNDDMKDMATKIFEKHFELDPKLMFEFNDRQKMLMFEDILYNLSYLKASIQFNDDKIFTEYSVWLYQLLCNLMKNTSKERVKEQLILNYKILKEVYAENHSASSANNACNAIDKATEAVEKFFLNFFVSDRFEKGDYKNIKKKYIEFLMERDTKGAIELIGNAAKSGIGLNDIYVKIVQEVMYEIGNLWHQNIITIDKEHYCTATTQIVLSQFYPLIFSTPRNNHKMISCCVGSELHEMGIRMLSDLFEYSGWDSIYLGASVPKDSILHSIEENKPDFVALSVTMPQHLQICHEIVAAIKEKYPEILIAVGGRAFFSTDKLWEKWNVDIFTENAIQLIEWADKNIVHKR